MSTQVLFLHAVLPLCIFFWKKKSKHATRGSKRERRKTVSKFVYPANENLESRVIMLSGRVMSRASVWNFCHFVQQCSKTKYDQSESQYAIAYY